VLADFEQKHCRCHIESNPPLKKLYPDPYEGTMYEDDPQLCYGLLNRPFTGCDYPYKGTIPGQFGIWERMPHAAHYPYTNPDWPCPPKFEPCCKPEHCNPDIPPKPKQPKCYHEITDGTVTGDFMPCCCSEYYAGNCEGGGAGDEAICDTWGEGPCGCIPYKEPEVLPLCRREDGSFERECPNDKAYTISAIKKKKVDSRGGIHICGNISIYYSRDANYTFCGGYKYKV
jgi:hypothetical protein